jgi:hypothetical protein
MFCTSYTVTCSLCLLVDLRAVQNHQFGGHLVQTAVVASAVRGIKEVVVDGRDRLAGVVGAHAGEAFQGDAGDNRNVGVNFRHEKFVPKGGTKWGIGGKGGYIILTRGCSHRRPS